MFFHRHRQASPPRFQPLINLGRRKFTRGEKKKSAWQLKNERFDYTHLKKWG